MPYRDHCVQNRESYICKQREKIMTYKKREWCSSLNHIDIDEHMRERRRENSIGLTSEKGSLHSTLMRARRRQHQSDI